jgi:hypothetical protein
MSNSQPDPNSQQLLTTILQASAESVQLNRQNSQLLNDLTLQVGHLTEGLAEVRYLIQEQSEVSKRQAETAERQERNIDRLVGIVDRLIQERPRP